MTFITIPDFPGDNAVHSIVSIMVIQGVAVPNPPLARMMVFREVTGGAAGTRLGGSNVSATNGIPFTTSDSLVLPALSFPPGLSAFESPLGYPLDQIYLRVPTGDTVAIGFVVF
jgi:hypothetical protein